MNDFIKAPRREPLALQLTAMIDIYSMIVIFLILGTVNGAADLALPSDLRLPRSMSQESMDAAPRLIFTGDQIQFPVADVRGPVDAFRHVDGPELAGIRDTLKAYVDRLPPAAKTAGTLLNVVADRDTPYADIFDVVKVFREVGFDTLLMVTVGKSR